MAKPKRRDDYRTLNVRCQTSGKVCYPSQYSAHRVMDTGGRGMSKRGHKVKNVYYCKHCNGYHLTSCTPNKDSNT